VVGRDKKLAAWRQRAAALGVGERVFFLGPVEDPREALGAADLFLLPTIYDPCPNAGLEAMACGLPVVTSSQCGLAEILQEHGGGMACEARDIAAIRAALLALDDPVKRASQGAAARAAVLPLTAEAMSARLLALYHRLLAEAGAAAQGV
ncbi:MAG: glycosyltransferase family 4 protein, partial [Burkholderiales bacterium]